MNPHDQIVRANGVELCVETFGGRTDPAILLIHGSSASMDWWEDEFCRRLADGSRFVIRYDHRDTGRSITYEPGAPRYTFDDLAEDAIGLLDTFGLAQAHLVGMSMGGGLAQLAAVDHPDRVASLTLIATAPAAPGPGNPDLPSMSEETQALFAEAAPPDWSDRAAVIDYGTYLARVSASRSEPFDEAAMRELWRRVFDRTTNVASTMTNHSIIDGSGPWRDRLGQLATTPTLVIHGIEDPVVPYGNALALVNEIPGAHLLTLQWTGHELPQRDWGVVVPAILKLTEAADR